MRSARHARKAERNSHDIVVVTCENGNTSSTLPVPYPDSLIIGSRDDPRVLLVEETRSNIVKIYPVPLASNLAPAY